MIYRVLGGTALALGGIFGLIALLVLLPFLSNYNVSLLVLTAVFGIIAYVLLAIGWQLLHPPRARRVSEGQDAERETTAAGHEPARAEIAARERVEPPRSTPGAPPESSEPAAQEPATGEPASAEAPESRPPEGTGEVPPAEESERREAAATAIHPGPGFAGFDEEPADQRGASSNGESGRSRARTKKPGAAVPNHESRP